MEVLAEHKLEPELTAPVPRPLHLPLRGLLLLLVATLLLGLFVLGSARALWEGAKLSWLAGAGQTINGKIVEIRTELMEAKDQPPRQTALRYAVDIPGSRGLQHRTGWIVLGEPPVLPNRRPPQSEPVFQVGQPFEVRYASLLGLTFCQPWGPGFGSRIITLFLAGGLVLVVSLFLLRRLLRWSFSRLHLLRQGTATVGTITHKRSEAEDMVRYFLRYGYADASAQVQDREEQVSVEQWRRFHVGEPVTVLYDPAHPAHAGLYALIVQG